MTPAQKIWREDRDWLLNQPQFRRCLFEIYSAAGITRTTREEPNVLHLEGKRSLGLEILGWFSAEAEPHDIIALAVEARINFKGARHDDRESEPE